MSFCIRQISAISVCSEFAIVNFTFDSKGNTTYMPVFAQNGSNLVCALVDTRSR